MSRIILCVCVCVSEYLSIRPRIGRIAQGLANVRRKQVLKEAQLLSLFSPFEPFRM